MGMTRVSKTNVVAFVLAFSKQDKLFWFFLSHHEKFIGSPQCFILNQAHWRRLMVTVSRNYGVYAHPDTYRSISSKPHRPPLFRLVTHLIIGPCVIIQDATCLHLESHLEFPQFLDLLYEGWYRTLGSQSRWISRMTPNRSHRDTRKNHVLTAFNIATTLMQM